MKLSLPGFVESTLDRSDAVRNDPEALAAAFRDPGARRILIDRLDPVVDGDRLARAPLTPDAELAGHVFLGRDPEGTPLFAALGGEMPHGARFAPRVWEAAELLDPPELTLFAAARSLIDWHNRHGFCANCGSATRPTKAGWSRLCGACGAEHFPRVDPVVIMLAEHEGRVLVGRSAHFPPGRYSALAGFVEPGETIEAAVARELSEEAGVRVRDVRYVMSQPWPFPSSLMVACMAQADDDALTIDANELEDAFWVGSDAVRAALDGDASAPFAAPNAMAIAHHLLRHWLERG